MEIEDYLTSYDIDILIMAICDASRHCNDKDEFQKYNDVLNKLIRIPQF